MGVGRVAGIRKFQQIWLFSKLRVVKTKFHHFWPPAEKLFEKSTGAPPEKHPFDAHALQNYTIFGKNYVVFHRLATLFNNTNAVSKLWQGDRLCTVCYAKQSRNPAKLQIIYYKEYGQNTAKSLQYFSINNLF